MNKEPWQNEYARKLFTAEVALANIHDGQTIFLGSGAAEPLLLTETTPR